MDEEKKGKEDGPEAVREERKKEKEDGPEAVSEERKEKKNEVEEVQREKEDESQRKLNFTGWQLQLAVLMVLIAKSKAHGGHDDPSDQANTEAAATVHDALHFSCHSFHSAPSPDPCLAVHTGH